MSYSISSVLHQTINLLLLLESCFPVSLSLSRVYLVKSISSYYYSHILTHTLHTHAHAHTQSDIVSMLPQLRRSMMIQCMMNGHMDECWTPIIYHIRDKQNLISAHFSTHTQIPAIIRSQEHSQRNIQHSVLYKIWKQLTLNGKGGVHASKYTHEKNRNP